MHWALASEAGVEQQIRASRAGEQPRCIERPER